MELRIDAAVLEEEGGTRVVIPYGERVELDGRRVQLVRGRSAELTHASPALVESLKAWRKQRAASDHVPAYIVLSDAHLEGIADRRPGIAVPSWPAAPVSGPRSSSATATRSWR